MKGYHIKIKGLNLDNTIEKLNRANVVMHELKRASHQDLEFKTSHQDYNKVKPIIEPYEKEITPLGFNLFKKIVATNLAVLIALPICIMIFYFCSNLLWKIEIQGTENINKQEILSILQDNGIKIAGKKHLSAEKIEDLLIQNDHIAQVSCYYKGSTLFINISEKLVYVQQEYSPIVAKYNGIIMDANITRGTINFVIGEYVSKGDILVYPYLLDKSGNQVPVEPQAEITAKCFITETNIIPRKENILTRSGKTKTYYDITFNEKKNPAKNRKPFVFYETMVYNNYISSVLPLVRQQTVYYELTLTEKVNDLEGLITQNEQLVVSELSKKMPAGATVIDQKVASMIIEDSLYSTAYLTCVSAIS